MKNNVITEKDKKQIQAAEQLREKSEAQGIRICTIENENYPHELRDISGRPAVLYYKGDIALLNRKKSVAVIGSRSCSERGRKLARQTGQFLAENNIAVVNGLALGCDTEALQGVLSSHGTCAVFLPCGLDTIVPRSNSHLADLILAAGGCLISEYPIETPVIKHQYIARDRLQSGASNATLIIEADLKSGTMHTAEFAAKQYKRLLCYYHGLLEISSGNKYLEQSGLASPIHNEQELNMFIDALQKEPRYEQMSLFS